MKPVTQYELLSLVNPDLSDDQLQAFLGRIRAVITEGEGEISTEELWGKRRLAYEVSRFREGVYHYMVFQGGPEIPRLLDEFGNTEPRLLRHLCTVIPKRKVLEDERRSRVEAERARREEEEARKAAEAAPAAAPEAAPSAPAADLAVPGEGAARVPRKAKAEEGRTEPATEAGEGPVTEAKTAEAVEGAESPPGSSADEPSDQESKGPRTGE